MKALILLVVGLVAIACNSCAPQPAPVPPPPAPAPTVMADAAPAPTDAAPAPEDEDAARKATASTACTSMHLAGCDEAESVSACTSVVQHAVTAKLTKVDLTCLTAAKTKLAVRKCSFVECP